MSLPSARAHLRREGGSSVSGVPFKTVWSANCVWLESAISMRQTRCCGDTYRCTTRNSPCRLPNQDPPFTHPAETGWLCFALSPRTVGLDNVVRFRSHRLQVLPDGRYSYARAKVEVRQAFNGSLSVYYQGHRLDIRPAPPEAPKLRESVKQENLKKGPGQYAKPAPDHPWRGKFKVHSDRG